MQRKSPWTPQQSAARKAALEDAEASLRIEGLDPSADPRYQTVRAALVAGTMTLEEASAAIDALFGVNRKPADRLAVPA